MRDLRDPQKLGDAMLNHMSYHKSSTMTHEWPAGHELPKVGDVSKDDSMCKITVAEYRQELEERTDKYAKSALEMLHQGELPKKEA